MVDENLSDERELIERLCGGDEAALEPLLTRHLPGLRAFVRARIGPLIRDREEDADVVQSVCREILVHRDRFREPADDGFKRWLYLTALRKIQNRQEHWLAQKRDVGREVPAAGADEVGLLAAYGTMCTPSRELMAQEAIAKIEAAVDALPDDYREVLTLARMVGLSRSEIAVEMGRKEGAVRTLLSRAQARLAELLE